MTQTKILCPIHGRRFWEIFVDGTKQLPVCEDCSHERWLYFLRNASKIEPARDEQNIS